MENIFLSVNVWSIYLRIYQFIITDKNCRLVDYFTFTYIYLIKVATTF